MPHLPTNDRDLKIKQTIKHCVGGRIMRTADKKNTFFSKDPKTYIMLLLEESEWVLLRKRSHSSI